MCTKEEENFNNLWCWWLTISCWDWKFLPIFLRLFGSHERSSWSFNLNFAWIFSREIYINFWWSWRLMIARWSTRHRWVVVEFSRQIDWANKKQHEKAIITNVKFLYFHSNSPAISRHWVAHSKIFEIPSIECLTNSRRAKSSFRLFITHFCDLTSIGDSLVKSVFLRSLESLSSSFFLPTHESRSVMRVTMLNLSRLEREATWLNWIRWHLTFTLIYFNQISSILNFPMAKWHFTLVSWRASNFLCHNFSFPWYRFLLEFTSKNSTTVERSTHLSCLKWWMNTTLSHTRRRNRELSNVEISNEPPSNQR